MQIVGYDATEGGLLVSDRDGAGDGAADRAGPPESTAVPVEYVSLDPGADLDYRLGDRHCAGIVTDDGHRSCDDPDAPHCTDHTSTWVCARCTGSCLKDEMDCFDDHAVYLAAFAPDTFKVGVTKEWRLETRLREQGADRGAHLRTVENGKIAREIEAGLAAGRQLRDWTFVDTETVVRAVEADEEYASAVVCAAYGRSRPAL